MYMVVWRLSTGRELSRFRTYFRRAAAERRLLKEVREFPEGDYRVARVSFWLRCAFWPTVFVYGMWVVGIAYVGLMMWLVLVHGADRGSRLNP